MIVAFARACKIDRLSRRMSSQIDNARVRREQVVLSIGPRPQGISMELGARLGQQRGIGHRGVEHEHEHGMGARVRERGMRRNTRTQMAVCAIVLTVRWSRG